MDRPPKPWRKPAWLDPRVTHWVPRSIGDPPQVVPLAKLPEEQIHGGVGEENENFGPTVRSLAFAIFRLILFWCWALYPMEWQPTSPRTSYVEHKVMEFLESIAEGMPTRCAAAIAQIPFETVRNWMSRNDSTFRPDFTRHSRGLGDCSLQEYQEAQAGKDWRAHAWWLERNPITSRGKCARCAP
jgi:hypothetical protein